MENLPWAGYRLQPLVRLSSASADAGGGTAKDGTTLGQVQGIRCLHLQGFRLRVPVQGVGF